MSNQALQSVSSKNRSTWAIVDGLPPLRSKQDFQRYAHALQTCAYDSKRKNSQINPLVWIPHESIVEDKFTTNTQIKGFGLIAFAYKDEMQTFVDNWRRHNSLRDFAKLLKICSYNDYLNLQKLPPKYSKLKKDDYFSSRNLIWWQFDEPGKERFRDQFVLRFRGPNFEETKIYWMEELVKTKKVLSYGGEKEKAKKQTMTRLYVQWSSQGYYLVTMHPQGVQLWGGPEWLSLHKMQHSQVQYIDFSPCDQFMVTCNAQPRQGGDAQAKRDANTQLMIWDTLTGQLKRPFDFEKIGPTIKTRHKGWWPIIHWSHDGKYFAKIASTKKMAAKPKDYDRINIYSTTDMRQLDNLAHTAPSLYHMAFSPSDDLLAYSTFQSENDPASVSIITLPNKNHARASQVLGFDIGTAHLYWQSEGKFLAIKMGHLVSRKTNRINHHSIGIIAIKKPNMPYSKINENLKLGKIEYFAWEPNSNRFAVIHGAKLKFHVSFFSVAENGNLKLILTLENRRYNTIKWAPMGGRCVIAFIEAGRTGVLEFVDINNYFTHKETIIVEHNNCREIKWDASGRYLVSAATQSLSSAAGDDTGYIIYSFQGKEIYRENIRYFYQFLWRPRPKLMLNNKEIHRVRSKEMREYSKGFNEIDREVLLAETSEKIRKNQRKLDQWNKKYLNNIDHRRTQKNILNNENKLRSHYSIDLSNEYDITTIEEEINVKFENHVISKDTLNKIISNEKIDFNNLDEHGNLKNNKNSRYKPNYDGGIVGYSQNEGQSGW